MLNTAISRKPNSANQTSSFEDRKSNIVDRASKIENQKTEWPRNPLVISPLYAHRARAWFRTSTPQKRALSLPSIGKEGADSLSKGIFLPMGDHGRLGSLRRAFSPLYDDFPRRCKWLTTVDRVYYGTKACGWNPRFLHSFEPKGLSGREREGKTDKRSTVCVGGSPKIDPSSCRVDQMRTIHGGVFLLINSTLHSVSSKVTGKLVVSLQPF